MTFYSEMAQVAHELLEEFGAPGQVTHKVRSDVYDPDTGDYPEVTVTQDVTAAVFPIDQKLVDGATVLSTDEQAYLSAVGLTLPEPTQTLAWAGNTFIIMRVENLAPAGTSVLVTMIVRR